MKRALTLVLCLLLLVVGLPDGSASGSPASAAFTLVTPTRPGSFPLSIPTRLTGRTGFLAVSAGEAHTVALRADGTAAAAGDSLDGRTAVDGWTDLVAVSAGGRHTVGLTAAGTAVAIGSNDSGQCDVGTWTDLAAIVAGGRHTVGLRRDGTVVACGDDSVGQTDVAGWTDIVAIAAGRWNTVGVRIDGTVVLAGATDQGQGAVDGWTDVVAVSVGDAHILGLRADGSVLAAGRNEEAQCIVTGWSGIVTIAAGGTHSAALRWDGTVSAVGDNSLGQLGTSAWTGAISISAGARDTVAVKDSKDFSGASNFGTLLGAGGDSRGQTDLRPLTAVTMLSADFSLGSGKGFDLAFLSEPSGAFDGDLLFTSSNPTKVSVDTEGRIIAKSTGSATITVSSPTYGLSDTVIVTVPEPEPESTPVLSPRPRPDLSAGAPPTLVSDPSGPAVLSAGRDHVLVLFGDGKLTATGPGRYEELDATSLSAGAVPLFSVSAGSWHSAAVRTDGTVADVCKSIFFPCNASSWTGIVALASASGFLVGLRSDGTAVVTSGGPDVSTASWSSLIAVVAGGRHALGLRTDRTVVAAGVDDAGQTDVATWSDIVAVAAGGSHSIGLRSDYTVVAAGSNAFGQCDITSWTGIKGVVAGEDFTAGLRVDGTVIWTGRPFRGASEVARWSGILSLKAGRDFLAAIDSTGAILVSYAAGVPSADSLLSVLSTSKGSISPAFDPALSGPYRVEVSTLDDAVVVHASPKSDYAKVSGNGFHALDYGENSMELSVTAQNGSKSSYRLVIVRRPPSATSATLEIDAQLSRLTGIPPGTLVENVVSAVTATGATVGLFTAQGTPASGRAGTGMLLRVYIDTVVYQELVLVIYGDLNGDGLVSAADLLLQKRRILGLSALGAPAGLAADVDFNGRIAASDLLLLKRHILGISSLRTK
jgi:alpha-tubulin suppressor-like RCC1 family protein